MTTRVRIWFWRKVWTVGARIRVSPRRWREEFGYMVTDRAVFQIAKAKVKKGRA